MPQIALVSDKHDDNVGVGMVAQLLQPPCDVLVGLVLADVVDEQRSDGAAVVCGGNSAVSLLAGGIPDLSLDGFGVDLDGAGGELDTDGRLGVEVELVASESAQQVGFTNARVSDEDDCGGSAGGAGGTEGPFVPLKRNCGQTVSTEHKRLCVARSTHVIFVVRHGCGRWGRGCAMEGVVLGR
jgi:hypothetical protein